MAPECRRIRRHSACWSRKWLPINLPLGRPCDFRPVWVKIAEEGVAIRLFDSSPPGVDEPCVQAGLDKVSGRPAGDILRQRRQDGAHCETTWELSDWNSNPQATIAQPPREPGGSGPKPRRAG